MKKVVIIISSLLVIACGTRKVQVRKNKIQYSFNTEVDTTNTTQATEAIVKEQQTTAVSFLDNLNIEYQGLKKGDSITLYKLEKDGKIHSGAVLKGTGKIVISSKKETATANTVVKENSSRENSKTTAGTTKMQKEVRSDNKEKESESSSYWWLLLIAVILIIRFFWKRYNRLKNISQQKFL
ncbi:MAG: hypothetical protein BM557_01245 [Flavobacterium sp. MedPE-SWcel]|uniref:hypothetical protein n=1 Tax=uncultured Flavobacterium sp. TaxID=165435 RepID=UPI00091C0BA9|nr:hypothetical protein [uncultured Flavobacterium sp.]OIQ22032.1 MAG: hypothetical protein BM557_01245 [Flavobacterium sp. MedPE-SWcel]